MPRNLIGLLTGGALLLAPGWPSGLAGQHRAPAFEAWDGAIGAAPRPPAPVPAGRAEPAAIRWYHGVGALGVVALVSVADERVREESQSHRTATRDDVARVFKRMGEPMVYVAPAVGTVAAGLILGDGRVRRAGGRMAAGLLTAGFVTTLLKPVLGRRRPFGTTNAFDFHPFTDHQSLPSGHTTMAFALATGISDEVRFLPLTIGLYSAATLTAWSRINDNRHWVSDAAAGALIGVASAKLMNGRWRVFGISAPRFLLEPGGVGVSAEF